MVNIETRILEKTEKKKIKVRNAGLVAAMVGRKYQRSQTEWVSSEV